MTDCSIGGVAGHLLGRSISRVQVPPPACVLEPYRPLANPIRRPIGSRSEPQIAMSRRRRPCSREPIKGELQSREGNRRKGITPTRMIVFFWQASGRPQPEPFCVRADPASQVSKKHSKATLESLKDRTDARPRENRASWRISPEGQAALTPR